MKKNYWLKRLILIVPFFFNTWAAEDFSFSWEQDMKHGVDHTQAVGLTLYNIPVVVLDQQTIIDNSIKCQIGKYSKSFSDENKTYCIIVEQIGGNTDQALENTRDFFLDWSEGDRFDVFSLKDPFYCFNGNSVAKSITILDRIPGSEDFVFHINN